jgi:molybdenum cofactor biosynthesis protein MoaC
MTGLELKVNMKEIDGPKGPVFSTAIICGVLGSKRTSELIPFCHNIPIESCDISIDILNSESVGVYGIVVNCKVSTSSKTGVEMEAMMGASLASLCIYDMLKAASHHIQITNIKLVSKSGGKSCFIST